MHRGNGVLQLRFFIQYDFIPHNITILQYFYINILDILKVIPIFALLYI